MSLAMDENSNGPTLNSSYNRVLKRWWADGHPSTPECEECGCDLTGKKVFETPTLWVCEKCNEEDQNES